MFELKGGDGQPLFNQLRIGLSCAKCQAAGKAADCTHMKDVIPVSIGLSILFVGIN